MTKKELKNKINKAVYQFAEKLGYQISDDNDGSYVTFSKPDYKDAYDTIDWSRSNHETTVLERMASKETVADAKLIDEHAQIVIEHYYMEYEASRS